jgi:hypothetical protein
MSAQNNSQRTIAPHLIQAYRNAQYFVHYGEEVLLLKVGFINHALGNLIKAQGKATAAFLTAYNPHSQPQDETINAQAHERLLERLRANGIAVIEGLGTDPDEDWDAEPSVLALGLTLSQAEALADEFGQNAFLWIANPEGFVNLKLRYPVGDPSDKELAQWLDQLPEHLRPAASALSGEERNWLMSATEAEQHHWLAPESWDWNTPWPNTRPDGCPIAFGTEMDRMFKLVSNGMEKFYP